MRSGELGGQTRDPPVSSQRKGSRLQPRSLERGAVPSRCVFMGSVTIKGKFSGSNSLLFGRQILPVWRSSNMWGPKRCCKAALSPHLCRELLRRIMHILFMRFLFKPLMYSVSIAQAYCVSSVNPIRGHISVRSSIRFQKYELKFQCSGFGVGLNVIQSHEFRDFYIRVSE